ncbi:hypothetical protein [Pseudoalteromonas sp. Z9A6]|uniref:hypothetical protein n=1 Tax=Pseudoalteromonas sp. Z9A6 TaxID=2686352 RepID=UPI0013FE022D|nr:hypothetical protein [Pseudoalteromonas sp. Z9A6]
MSLSLVIKGADFSANSLGNAFYPHFNKLTAARFYGSDVPDFTGLKKSNKIGAKLSGLDSVINSYSLSLPYQSKYSTDLVTSQKMTFCAYVKVPQGATSTSQGVITSNNTSTGLNPYEGQFLITLSVDTTRALGKLSVFGDDTGFTTASSLNAQQDTLMFIVGVMDATSGDIKIRVYSEGTVKESVASGSFNITDGDTIFINNYPNEPTTIEYLHTSIFNDVLTSTEIDEVFNWVDSYYSDKL